MQRTERSVLRFYASSLKHLLSSRWHSALRRERHYEIGGHEAVLPPGHRLPWFQAVFPAYDKYAESILAAVTAGTRRPLLIDVGANIGDTVLLAAAAVPSLRIKAVEGNPDFGRYLTANTSHLGDLVEVVDRFVSVPLAQPLVYSHTGSTGGFQPGEEEEGHDFVTVEELLADADQHDLTIWKSDTDGLDIPILLSDWDRIEASCGVIWFEFDPFRDVNDAAQLPELCDRIKRSGRVVHVVDNTGRSMMTVPSDVAGEVLMGLTHWLTESAVPGDTSYFDIWLLSPGLTHADAATGLLAVGPPGESQPASVD